MTEPYSDRDLIFGAARHDPAFWREHPMVAESEAHFDGDHGWVGLTTRDTPEPRQPCVTAAYVSPADTRDAPDLYFFGEGDCPISLFEHAPAIREVRVAIEGPIEGDSRTCWSVGLWREPQGS
jgi:hypothetical protein